MACANCLHDDLIRENEKIKKLKIIFNEQAKIGGWEDYAIIKCSCESGYAWRPVKHPDVREYGAVEFCTVD